jgi:hypothetical protein
MKALAYSALLGWWGMPFGLIITPYQLTRKVAGMLRGADRPSPDFIRVMRIRLADRVAAVKAKQS